MNVFTVDVSVRHAPRREDGAARGWALARKLALGLSLALACQCALAQAMYRIKPLGYLGGCTSSVPSVAGLNGKDEVAGTACNANGDSHAFLWRNNGKPMIDLGPEGIGTISYATAFSESGLVTGQAWDAKVDFAFESSGDGAPMTRIDNGLGSGPIYSNAINDLGQLTGEVVKDDGSEDAFLWKNDGTPMVDLGSLNFTGSIGNAINASGQVAGQSRDDSDMFWHAFIWKNDGTPMVKLGALNGRTSFGQFINAFGQVVGYASVIKPSGAVTEHVFIWRNDGTPMQDLGALAGGDSHATAFNDSGQIAGYSNSLYVRRNPHAFVWMNDGTPMKDLGTFGGTQSAANDMNFSGQVAGYANLAGDAISHAFLWRNDGTKIQDLNKLVDPTDPLKPYVTLTSGGLINDKGNILAQGTDSRTGLSAPYLLLGTVITLTPRSLAFGSHPINTKSAAKSVTMTNTSAKVVAITSIALKGSNPGQFASTNNCGSSLVGHATCTIKVSFKPTTKGAKSATLNVNGGGEGLRSVSLTGTGT